jgi:hypothetical protein
MPVNSCKSNMNFNTIGGSFRWPTACYRHLDRRTGRKMMTQQTENKTTPTYKSHGTHYKRMKMHKNVPYSKRTARGLYLRLVGR